MNTDLFLPIGVENFESLIKNSYYIDKTGFIKTFLSSASSSVYLITRPRRFGKSLMLSMLEDFFDCRKDTRHLFENLQIGKEDPFYFNNINSFCVVHLNFKNLSKRNVDDFYAEMKAYMASIYKQYDLLKDDCFSDLDVNYINKILYEKETVVELTSSLSKLCELLHIKYFKKVVVLIDEYDSPIIDAHQHGYYDEAVNFFKDFLGKALKSNIYISRALVTGVVQVAQASIFSGINNFRTDDMITGVGEEYFGFKEDEVKELLSYYHVEYDLNKLKSWYGNYLFKGQEIYSNWSVLNFVLEGGNYKPYWINTSHYNIFNYFSGGVFMSLLNELLNGDDIKAELSSIFNFDDELSRTQLLSLLTYSGYLRAEKTAIDEVYSFKIANNELKKAIVKDIRVKFINNNNVYRLLDDLYRGFVDNDVNLIENNIKDYLLSTWSYFEMNAEKHYQIMMLTLSSILFEKAYIKSEVTAGDGRLDILIINNLKSYCFVIETKLAGPKTSETNLVRTAVKAVEQIEKHHYYEVANGLNVNQVTLIGFAFTKNRVKVHTKKVK